MRDPPMSTAAAEWSLQKLQVWGHGTGACGRLLALDVRISQRSIPSSFTTARS